MRKDLTSTAFAQGFADGIYPDPPIAMDEWADKYRRLSEKSSPEPGQWKTSRVPFMAEPMQSLSTTTDVQDVSLMKGTQISGTETGNNFVGYVIDHVPGSMMVVQPTLDMGKRYSRQRVDPMINDMPILKEKVATSKSRDGGNTLLEKDFIGGYLVITGANSATGLRSMPVRFLFMDETDAYPFDLDNEGDPEQLAVKRTQNFSRKKILRVSTPTVDGMSRIQKSFLRGDQRYYHVPCPHCGSAQKLVWDQLKWNKNLPREQQPASVYYECKDCHEPILEHEKTNMLALGTWIPENPDAPAHRRSYHINSLYSPLGWYSWANAVEDFLDAQGDIELLKTFTNTVLAEVWKESINDVSAKMLQSKAEPYEMGIVPKGGLEITAGVDTQDDRLEVYVYAWGRSEESWLVDYTVIFGDPGIPPEEQWTTEQAELYKASGTKSPWDELTDYLHKPWPMATGHQLFISQYAVDTGGHHTHDVYNFVRRNQRHGAIAVKGASQSNKPIIGRPSWIDIDWRGRTIKRGLQLYMVGTDTAKSTIYNRYQKEEKGGAGYMHYPDGLPLEIFEQLTAEKLTRRYRKGFAIYEWTKSSASRNEGTDCTVYAYAAALKLGIHRYSNAKWDSLEEKLTLPVAGDLFNQPAIPKQTKKTTSQQSRGQSTSGFKESASPW